MALLIKEHRTTKNPEWFSVVIDEPSSRMAELTGAGGGARCLQLVHKDKLVNFPVGKTLEGMCILVTYVDKPLNEKHKQQANGKYKCTELAFVN